jgi:hypothetical protein
MHLIVDSDLRFRVVAGSAKPMLTVPLLDLSKLAKPSIIDDF